VVQKIDEVGVLRDEDNWIAKAGGRIEDVPVRHMQETKVLNVRRVLTMLGREPTGKRGRELSVNPNDMTRKARLGGRWVVRPSSHLGSGSHDRMIHLTGSVEETSRDVLPLEVGKLSQDGLGGLARRKQLQDVQHPDSHAANAGPTPTLSRLNRDSAKKLRFSHTTSWVMHHSALKYAPPATDSKGRGRSPHLELNHKRSGHDR
jgi:hypothetical protein